MTARDRCLLATLLLVIASPADAEGWFAEPATVPAEPAAGQEVFAVVRGTGCDAPEITVQRVGFAIDLSYELAPCPILPIVWELAVGLGPLDAGSFTLQLVNLETGLTEDVATLVVIQGQAPQVPAVHPLGMALLVAALALVAMRRLASGRPRPGSP